MNSTDRNSGLVEQVFTELRKEGFTISPRRTDVRTSASDPSARGPCECEQMEIGQVLTEDQVQKIGRKEGEQVLEIPADTIVTPLARERATDLRVELRRT